MAKLMERISETWINVRGVCSALLKEYTGIRYSSDTPVSPVPTVPKSSDSAVMHGAKFSKELELDGIEFLDI